MLHVMLCHYAKDVLSRFRMWRAFFYLMSLQIIDMKRTPYQDSRRACDYYHLIIANINDTYGKGTI